MKRHFWGCVLAAGLLASSAGAVEFFVPVPHLGDRYKYNTEFYRQDLNKINVDYTFVAEGASGVGVTPARYKVLPGPSTDKNHPLLTDNYDRDYRKPPARSEPRYYLDKGGLMIMEGEQGLLGIETAVFIGGDPTAGWELPMLTKDDAFAAGDTAWVLNLLKDGTTVSHLSLYNLDNTAGQCETRLLSKAGDIVELRTGIAVPARGGVRLADVLRRISAETATELSVAVTCDRTFYALGSFPTTKLTDVRLHYPSPDPPTLGTKETFISSASFRSVSGDSFRGFDLPLTPNTRYRSIYVDLDATTAAPQNSAYFRSLFGLWRPDPQVRFGKTLYFNLTERFNRSKLFVDLGTPYIEILTKKNNAPLRNNATYHFHVEINADQKLIRTLVTNNAGGVVADMINGLFNDDLSVKPGGKLTFGVGSPKIVDNAYSPPYNWRFSKIVVTGYKE